MNLDNILYLDVDFLTNKYEEETGMAPNTLLSKDEGMNAQAGVSFLKSKLHSQITKQFSTSSRVMLKAIDANLKNYPPHEPDLNPGIAPVNAWIEGYLTIGNWSRNKDGKGPVTDVFYEIVTNEIRYSLLPQSEYFLANLGALENVSEGLRRYIKIPVKALCKVLYPLPDIKFIVATPYIIKANG